MPGTLADWFNIMQGMYFAIIVDPKNGWGTSADKEFVLVQREFYTKSDSASGALKPDWQAALARNASDVVFNGRAGLSSAEHDTG